MLSKYGLGTKSNVAKMQKVMLERDFIVSTEQGLFLADPVMKLWLQHRESNMSKIVAVRRARDFYKPLLSDFLIRVHFSVFFLCRLSLGHRSVVLSRRKRG